MFSIQQPTFAATIPDLAILLNSAPPVKTERWQGVAVNTDTFELRNVNFEVPLKTLDLQHWRDDIGPSTPWADDHFLERIGGEPLNPGVQWAFWPWGNSASKFKSERFNGDRKSVV